MLLGRLLCCYMRFMHSHIQQQHALVFVPFMVWSMLVLVGKMPGFEPDIEKRLYNMTFLFKTVNTNFDI